jgi:hypothetical protein
VEEAMSLNEGHYGHLGAGWGAKAAGALKGEDRSIGRKASAPAVLSQIRPNVARTITVHARAIAI